MCLIFVSGLLISGICFNLKGALKKQVLEYFIWISTFLQAIISCTRDRNQFIKKYSIFLNGLI